MSDQWIAPGQAFAAIALAVFVVIFASVFWGGGSGSGPDELAIIESRELSGVFGPQSEVDMWRVRISGSGLPTMAMAPSSSDYRVGDCVIIRRNQTDGTVDRRWDIIDSSTACE